jgi:hypothetical protein
MKRRNSCGGLRRCLLLSILLVLSLPLSARGSGENNTTLRSRDAEIGSRYSITWTTAGGGNLIGADWRQEPGGDYSLIIADIFPDGSPRQRTAAILSGTLNGEAVEPGKSIIIFAGADSGDAGWILMQNRQGNRAELNLIPLPTSELVSRGAGSPLPRISAGTEALSVPGLLYDSAWSYEPESSTVILSRRLEEGAFVLESYAIRGGSFDPEARRITENSGEIFHPVLISRGDERYAVWKQRSKADKAVFVVQELDIAGNPVPERRWSREIGWSQAISANEYQQATLYEPGTVDGKRYSMAVLLMGTRLHIAFHEVSAQQSFFQPPISAPALLSLDLESGVWNSRRLSPPLAANGFAGFAWGNETEDSASILFQRAAFGDPLRSDMYRTEITFLPDGGYESIAAQNVSRSPRYVTSPVFVEQRMAYLERDPSSKRFATVIRTAGPSNFEAFFGFPHRGNLPESISAVITGIAAALALGAYTAWLGHPLIFALMLFAGRMLLQRGLADRRREAVVLLLLLGGAYALLQQMTSIAQAGTVPDPLLPVIALAALRYLFAAGLSVPLLLGDGEPYIQYRRLAYALACFSALYFLAPAYFQVVEFTAFRGSLDAALLLE